MLALATAQVLEQGGESVAFLGLVDTQPVRALYAAQGPTPVEELKVYFRRDRRDAFDAIAESERGALSRRRGKGPVDWSEHTTGRVAVETLLGEYMVALHSIHAHQQIAEALAAAKAACD